MDVVIQSGNLSRVSSVSRINILQSEANLARVFTSSEFVSDALSDNNSTGSSSVVPGDSICLGLIIYFGRRRDKSYFNTNKNIDY